MDIKDDIGHKLTDEMLEELEGKLKGIYKECFDEVVTELEKIEEILNNYTDKMSKTERMKLWEEQDRLSNLLISLSEDIANSNQFATRIINDDMLNVYNVNYQFGNYLLEKESKKVLELQLYNKAIIKELLKDDSNPFYKIALSELEDKERIYRGLKNSFIKSIRLGESIDKITRRIKGIINKNENDSRRIARTETTRLESIGRQEAFKKGEEMGLKLKKVWISTNDKRTRDSHALLMGKAIPLNARFSNGLRYPADYNGQASEVCNCRCTHIVEFVEVEKGSKLKELDKELEHETFLNWRERRL